jgi:hypothetical protein
MPSRSSAHAILAILTIAGNAYYGWAYARYIDANADYGTSFDAFEGLQTAANAIAAWRILSFVVAIGLVVQASLTRKAYQPTMPAVRVSS